MMDEAAAKIEEVIDSIIAIENDFVDHPEDRGGPTRWGITESVARANDYRGGMHCLPLNLARHIYKKRYIVDPGFDRVVEVDKDIGLEVIDTGVNCGPAVAAMFLQRWLNGFNFKGYYSDLFVDSRIGPVSISALRGFLSWRGERGKIVLLRGLNSVQGSRYLNLAEEDISQREFLFGWISKRVEI